MIRIPLKVTQVMIQYGRLILNLMISILFNIYDFV